MSTCRYVIIRISWKVPHKRLLNSKDDDTSLSHTLFNLDPGFRYMLILTIGIKTLIESVCGKLNMFTYFHVYVMQLVRYMTPRFFYSYCLYIYL